MAPRHAVLVVAVCFVAATAFGALKLPANMNAEATGPQGAVVSYFAGADGSGDDENGRPIDKATCSPASGATFPIGTTTVNCSATTGETGSFQVTVADTRGPSLHLPRDFTVQGTSQGAAVTYSATAQDTVDGAVSVHCSPASGSVFQPGTTTVQCTSSDSRQNMSAGSFAVTVLVQQPPPPPPPLNDITVEATGPNGAVVTFNSSGGPGDQDDENGRPIGNCAPASGSIFPIGSTTVQCSNGTFKVNVVDTTAPVLSLPANITTQNAAVTYTASATDLVDGSVAVTCTPASGSTFAVGTTTVNCSASDTRGNSAAGSFTVTVEEAPPPADTEAPTITSLSATPDTIAPPNGKLVAVTISASVHDNVDASPFVGVYDVTSNETISASDWNVVSPLSVELRAERSPQGSGRVYTIWVEAIDDAGNRSVSSVNVTVPHDQSSSGGSTAPKQWRGIRRGH
ncbi:MAG TPA: HYR domain-containing protein [Thermoanaerobaculia bacterium]